MDAEVSTHTFLTKIIEESVCFMSSESFFVCAIILMWYTRNIFLLASDIFFINWTVRMGDHLPERVQILGHGHIICITVRENRIICCQIFCDLLLKYAFEQICNVMQLILVKIKWKHLIQKFHDICLSYYFNQKSRKKNLINIWNKQTKNIMIRPKKKYVCLRSPDPPYFQPPTLTFFIGNYSTLIFASDPINFYTEFG